ncbi:putative quorum-sensing-regulated virulence factor [Sulfurimonas sp.]|uniref:putative quorum-sensing-regulated virulence factor n=1 Tax=Sulfurimonas sp. TaxID=2022749 RepID=UPI0035675943
MTKAHLVFTKYHNSYRVDVKNLEQLSVEQIQELQRFVENRKGVFDFASYSFVIQKRIEYYEFIALIEHTDIKARCEENIIEVRSQPRVGFGQYKGMQYSDLPDSYMLWLKTNYRGYGRELIEAELKKRNL